MLRMARRCTVCNTREVKAPQPISAASAHPVPRRFVWLVCEGCLALPVEKMRELAGIPPGGLIVLGRCV